MWSLLLAPLVLLSSQDADWPCWRGSARDGVAPALPFDRSAALVAGWTTQIGRGYSSPSIVVDAVYVLGFDPESEQDVVRSLELESGAERWRFGYDAELRDRDHGGGTLTTPAVHEGRVFVTSRFGAIRCLDASTGDLLWFKDVLALYGVPGNYYGYASSPVVVGEQVFFAMEKAIALDAHTGDTLWVSESLDSDFSTPTPRLDPEGGSCEELAVFSQRGLHVLDAMTGGERRFFEWHKSDRLVNASSPVLVGDRVFVSSAYDHGCALIDLGAEGHEPEAVWARRTLRTKMAGCVLVNGHVFGFDESMLTCVDVGTGETRWRVRGLGNGAVSAAGDTLVVTTSKGELILADATGERFVERSRTKVFDDGGVYWSPPVIAGGRVFFRSSAGGLVALDGRGAAPLAEEGSPGVSEELPAATELFARHLEAIGGRDALASRPSITRTGSFDMNSVGFAATALTIRHAAPDLYRCRFGLPAPRDGHIERLYDGEHAYEVNAYLGHSLFGAEAREEYRQCVSPWSALRWTLVHPEAITVERVDFAGRACYRVVTPIAGAAPGTRARSYYFDVETGLCRGRDGDGEALVVLDAYRDFDGLRLPTVERRFTLDTGIEEVFRTESVSYAPIAAGTFDRPDEIQELVDAQGG